jgi:hypothetical protein
MTQCSCHYARDPNCAECVDLAQECGIAADRLMRDPKWLAETILSVVDRIGPEAYFRDFIAEDDLSHVARIRAEFERIAREETETEMRRAA